MKDKALKLAKECGATTCTNRHLPEATTVTFSPIAWEEFCAQALDSTLPVGTLLPTPPAQEPVALVIDGVLVKSELPEKYTGHLYTAPPQRTWVGLNEQDFSAINQSCLTKLQAAASAESILKEKNNG